MMSLKKSGSWGLALGLLPGLQDARQLQLIDIRGLVLSEDLYVLWRTIFSLGFRIVSLDFLGNSLLETGLQYLTGSQKNSSWSSAVNQGKADAVGDDSISFSLS